MAQTFWVENKKSSLGQQAILTAQELLDMVEGLESYSYDAVFLRQPLDRLQFIECGIVGASCFLFRLSYDGARSAYRLDLPDIFTETDWHIAEQTLQVLSAYTGNPVQGLSDFNLDVFFRQFLQEQLADKSVRFVTYPGIFHPVVLDWDSLQAFFESSSPIAAFEEVARKVQYCQGYFSQIKLYQTGESELRAVYSLAEGVATVLPKEPVLPASYLEQVLGKDIIWEVHLLQVQDQEQGVADYQPLAALSYQEFWDALPVEKLAKLDANQYLISPLTKQDLQALIA